jgi:lysine 2,3-aminomutase
MKGVNDDPAVLKKLFQKLLTIRVKPYYLYQADLTRGANHFRTPVSTGLSIMREIQGHTSGMAVPHYVIDAPGGGGKIPVLPSDYMISMGDGDVVLKNYEGKIFTYPDPSTGGDTMEKDSSHGNDAYRETHPQTMHPGMIDEAR